MNRNQRLVVLVDAVALGLLSVYAGIVLDHDRLVAGGAVLLVASALYGWATRTR